MTDQDHSTAAWNLVAIDIAKDWNVALVQDASGLRHRFKSLRANIDETESAAIITERGGQENHRERSQNDSSFCSQFA